MGDNNKVNPDTRSKVLEENGLLNLLEKFGKTAAIGAGILYGSGFVVFSIHLYNLQVTDFTLVRAQYLLAGMLAWLPVLLAVITFHYTNTIVILASKPLPEQSPIRKIKNPKLQRVFTLGFSTVAIIVMFGALTSLYYSFLAMQENPPSHYHALAFMMATLALAFFLLDLPKELGKWRKSGQGRDAVAVIRSTSMIHFGFLWPFILGVYFFVFVRVLFPLIPPQYGGGAPIMAKFLFNQEESKYLELLGIVHGDGREVSPPIFLYHEGKSFVIRRTEGGPIIRLEKGIVKAIISIEKQETENNDANHLTKETTPTR